MPRTTRSLKTPITLTSVAVALSLSLLIGWTVLVIDTLTTGTTWFFVLGLVSIAFITTVLLLSGISLAREIVEGRRQRTFIDSVTHELKSPLASLGLCLETLERKDLSDPQRIEVRQMMRHDVARLAAFIDGVLEASRLAHRPLMAGAGSRDNAAPVVLADLAETAIAHVVRRHPHATAASVALEVPRTLTVTVDEVTLTTVLENLLDNALKYSADNAQVTVSATTAAAGLDLALGRAKSREGVTHGDLVVTVSDHGIGIAEADLERIFRRFYRADSDEVRSRKGTGLGLHVAAELARELGGRLSATSAGPGRGSSFRLTLPGVVR